MPLIGQVNPPVTLLYARFSFTNTLLNIVLLVDDNLVDLSIYAENATIEPVKKSTENTSNNLHVHVL